MLRKYLPPCSLPLSILVLVLSTMLLTVQESTAQRSRQQESILTDARFGIGLNTVLSVNNGFGLGFRGRVSSPVNADFSLAIGMGFTGFVLQGRDQAVFVFDPQLSGIITLPERGNFNAPALVYLMAGIGAFVPLTESSSDESGPSIHFGIGRVSSLTESSFFYEINPAVVIGSSKVEFILPFRVGIIFGGRDRLP